MYIATVILHKFGLCDGQFYNYAFAQKHPRAIRRILRRAPRHRHHGRLSSKRTVVRDFYDELFVDWYALCLLVLLLLLLRECALFP